MGRCSEPANISKRNANVVAALITNFSTAEAALDSAANSTGSALAENDKYLDSINGRIAKLSATFESLSVHFVNTDFVKGIVSFGNTAVSTLDKIVSAAGAVPTAISAITAAVSTMRVARGKQTGIFDITRFARPKNGGLDSVFVLRHSITEYISAIKELNNAGGQTANIFDTVGGRLANVFTSVRGVASGLTDDINAYNRINQKISETKGALDQAVTNGADPKELELFTKSWQSAKDTGTEFMEAIEKNNKALSGYFKSLNGASASWAGFREYCK